MEDELLRCVDLLFNSYSALLDLATYYILNLNDAEIIELHYSRYSKITGGIPVGVVLRGSRGSVEGLCSLPISCGEGDCGSLSLPLVDSDYKLSKIGENLLLIKKFNSNNLYKDITIFIIKCGLLYKWSLRGGDVEREFEDVASRL